MIDSLETIFRKWQLHNLSFSFLFLFVFFNCWTVSSVSFPILTELLSASLYRDIHMCIYLSGWQSILLVVLPDMIWHIIIAVLDIGMSSWKYVRLYFKAHHNTCTVWELVWSKSHLQYLSLTGTNIFTPSLWLNSLSGGGKGEQRKAWLRFSTVQTV